MISYNDNDHNIGEIHYLVRREARKLGVLTEYCSMNVHYFGAKQSRDETADIFVSERLVQKMDQTLLFLHNHGFKVKIGLKDGGAQTETNYWLAFSYKMRMTRLAECIKILLCVTYETNDLLKVGEGGLT